MTVEAIYTAENCTAAYQLRWSLALFPLEPLPHPDLWLKELAGATEVDHVRILSFKEINDGNTLLFLVSTQPSVGLPGIIKSVKGRLIHTLRPKAHVKFHRNFRLTSVGDANLATVEKYVSEQTGHHVMACDRSQAALAEFQETFGEVDLSEPIASSHGQYVAALHLVLVHAKRWRITEPAFLSKTRDAIICAARKKRHRISRLSILADHVHLTLGIGYATTPAEVALSYMNNIAFRHGMLRMWMNSFYVGTIGPYGMKAVRG